MIKICINCGIEFKCKNDSRVKYCSDKCQRQHYRVNKTYTCKHCGKAFKPKAKDRTTYCSRECAYEDKKAKPKEVIKLICVICGKEFEGRANAKYCSDECYKIYSHERYINHKQTDAYKEDLKRKREAYEPKEKVKKTCICCGKEYETNKDNSKYCSEQCANVMHYTSESKKEERRRYRARKSSAYVAPVNTMDIYKRDKGICKICGKKIDLKLEYPHPMSLSIDHIIPLACGGTHEPKNVQIAHFICNSIKSSNSLEQGEQLRII